MIRLYNTLSKTVEDFIPINKNNIGMYFCGQQFMIECILATCEQVLPLIYSCNNLK